MRSHRRLKWLIGGVAALVVVFVGGPFVYIHFIEGKAPAKFHLSTLPSSNDTTTTADSAGSGTTVTSSSSGSSDSSGASGLDGTWKIASGSQAGYRVQETLFGQSNTAVGRTSLVTGSITIAGTMVTKGSFSVDMRTVTSDRSQRDGQFQGRIMETSRFPTATFTLTQPIDFGTIPAEGKAVNITATGDLTLHGVTKSVTFTISAQHSASMVQATGSIPITFADYNISNPSIDFVTTQDHGSLEFLLNFSRA